MWRDKFKSVIIAIVIDLHEATRFVPKLCNQIGRPYTEKIAVIGAGPAGMSLSLIHI